MKKKLLITVGMLLVTALLIGCGKNTQKVDAVRKDKETTYVKVDKLPHNLKYNDKTMPLTEVEMYQSETKYGHTLYATVKLDMADIDETDLHWMGEKSKNWPTEKVLSPEIEVTSDDGTLKDKNLTRVGFCDFGDYLVYYFMTTEDLKSIPSKTDVKLNIRIEQDEIYEENGRNKEDKYTYGRSYDDVNKIKDVDEMPEDIRTNLVNVMNQFSVNLDKIYG